MAPPGRGTRPTSDRVREAAFSMLESLGALEGARVWDLFSGSGAMGIEALSRGAVHVSFVDQAPGRRLCDPGQPGPSRLRPATCRRLSAIRCSIGSPPTQDGHAYRPSGSDADVSAQAARLDSW